MDSSAGETDKDASVNFLSATIPLDVKGTEEVHPREGEGWLMRCKSGLRLVSHQLFHDTFMSSAAGYAGAVYASGQCTGVENPEFLTKRR